MIYCTVDKKKKEKKLTTSRPRILTRLIDTRGNKSIKRKQKKKFTNRRDQQPLISDVL